MNKYQPKKKFGQNFLTDQHAIRTIAHTAQPSHVGTILEIGPGKGALTQFLLEQGERVVAIEFDVDLLDGLRTRFEEELSSGKFVLYHADALEVDWVKLLASMPEPHVVAGNIPYLITGALVEKATHLSENFERFVFMVQKEVAQRMVAEPGTEHFGALTVFIQAAFLVRKVITVKSGSFFPKPKVDSAVIELMPRKPRLAEETIYFREAVQLAFQKRRKMLRNAWDGLFGWSSSELEMFAIKAKIDLTLRGEVLSVQDFDRMAQIRENQFDIRSASRCI